MLPRKREMFCQEYIKDLNGTQAAIRAGYSPATADVQASQLLGNLKVKARIDELVGKRVEKVKVDVDELLGILLQIAKADTSKAYHSDGSLKNIHDLPDDLKMAIQEWEPRKKFKVTAREKAIDMLMKYTGGAYGIQAQREKEKEAVEAKETKSRDVKIVWSEREVKQDYYDKVAAPEAEPKDGN